MRILYIDDIRQPKYNYDPYNKNNELITIDVSTNYKDTIDLLNTNKYDIIDSDHDLGEIKTGYNICKYIVENNIKCDIFMIHTSNSVGRFNMYQLLDRYTNFIITSY